MGRLSEIKKQNLYDLVSFELAKNLVSSKTLKVIMRIVVLERVCAHGAGLCPVQSSDIWRGLKLENLTILRW